MSIASAEARAAKAYPRDSHAAVGWLAFFRKMLMPWHARAENTPNPFEQESFMNQHVDRRALLASSAVATAAVAAAVASVRDAHAEGPGVGALGALIAAKDAALARFNKAMDRNDEMESGYFATNRRELLVPLSIGGAQSLYVTAHDLEECSIACQIEICKRYDEARSRMSGLTSAAPEVAEQAVAALRKAEKADLRKVQKMIREEHAKRVAFGYGQALVELGEASQADIDALTAVFAYRCGSLEECRTKAEYLLTVTDGRFTEMLQHDSVALLQSFLPEGDAAA
ncbi:hypothetical protein EJ074_20475 [Mesorhizobium sp. M3A.F.Ca.ET.080.04.2.1]|uniref:hypothetical protein n=1 Tax=Mesorhizobium sp. M3A.F.Ca.ET.080.04.2.1 TaxID=2493676 RepID=UPI000F754883|nr:hypothetical protein [Mesorhizobium sp. M3A.F.Ca.ET.080.04.2.1]AZO11198.1 hypothetical protein EJ074_20475 [Mesorhizobium sp. M3A.F.Ca.ET.080.04.2.1]RWF23791.1 MAG: hypothetical protein EOS64_10095 [Mesorhizobium sp.]